MSLAVLCPAILVIRFDLPDATHVVHLDRAERGRQAFVDGLLAFLSKDRDNLS